MVTSMAKANGTITEARTVYRIREWRAESHRISYSNRMLSRHIVYSRGYDYLLMHSTSAIGIGDDDDLYCQKTFTPADPG